MEDVIEKLRELNGPIPVPLELLEEELLVEIEEKLLIDIPAEFREFLLLVSDTVYGRLELVTATDPHSHTYLPGAAAITRGLGVPRELIPLYEDDGSYYRMAEDGEMVLWADDGLTDESRNSVWVWACDV